MATHRRVKSKDEELGKRDDNYRPQTNHSPPSGITRPWRWRRKRILAAIAGTIMLYMLLHYLYAYLSLADEPFGMHLRPNSILGNTREIYEPTGPAPRRKGEGGSDTGKHYYDGPIKYYKLASSLNKISRTSGARQTNRNVLFAASSLKSVANLMPMACQMAKWNRNYVHLAIFGRDALPLEDVLEVNGISRTSCPVYFHDARSDYAEFSNERRAEVAVLGAMKHINDFMHPQAIIVDDRSLEDGFFVDAMTQRAKDLGRALIEVQAGKYEHLLWMTKLDTGSLASWHRPMIDILIQAPSGSSGGLIRLIRSLEQALYAGLQVPRLTIELPPDVEPFATSYLESLSWPPEKVSSLLKISKLTLRHRIPSLKLSPDYASVRSLESFFPVSTDDNHVLVLSTQAELGPLYFQYLFYAILEYRYSTYGSSDNDELLGISLDVPRTFINGSDDFNPPRVADMNSKKYTEDESLDRSAASYFLYEAPSSTATLVFGDKWATFHNYLSNRLTANQLGKAEKTLKHVSETESSWLEFLLELVRARGWSILHPSLSFVTVHSELSRIPEEYIRQKAENEKPSDEDKPADILDEQSFLTAQDPPVIPRYSERDTHDSLLSLHDLLPFDGDLPDLPALPYMYYTGDVISQATAIEYRDKYIPAFRQHIGGCEGPDADRKRIVRYLRTDDLFCLPGNEPQFDETPEDDDDDDKKTSENEEKDSRASDGESKDVDEELRQKGSPAKTEAEAGDSVQATVEATDGADADREPPVR